MSKQITNETRYTPDDFARMSHEVAADLINQIIRERDEARGVLELTQDEYVQQVGTWKIIQRLEEQLALLRRYHGGDGTVSREQVIEALGK